VKKKVPAPKPEGDEASAPGDGPLFSVVVAVYNRWPLIRETIESVLDQTFHDVELVVVDDGSTDGTPDQIERNFATVRVIRQENTERGAAYNHGVTAARGRFIAILGSDDVCEPWHLQQFADVLLHSKGIHVLAGRACLWDAASGRKRPHPDFNPATLARDALLGAAIPPQAMVVSREAFLAVRGYPEDRSTAASEDWVLLMKLVKRYQIQSLPSATASVRIRQHSGRSMADLPGIRRSREATTRLILEEDLLGFELDEEARRLIAAGTHRLAAAHHYGAGEMREARARIRDVWATVGIVSGLRWTGKLWLQTWLGKRASVAARRVKDRLT
jgi:glycosyltransferase involved in cell wall biosynthesis